MPSKNLLPTMRNIAGFLLLFLLLYPLNVLSELDNNERTEEIRERREQRREQKRNERRQEKGHSEGQFFTGSMNWVRFLTAEMLY